MDGRAAERIDPEAYRALFEHSADGVLFTRPDSGEILAVNRAACQLLGHDQDTLRRLGRDGILALDDRPRWDAALTQRAESGFFRGELSFIRADGTAFVAEVTSTVCTDTTSEARAWLILRDVTAQRTADEALRTSAERTRRLIETSTEAFIAMDSDGSITEWNHQAELTFGWSRAEAVGRRLADTVIPPKYRDDHNQGLARYLATGEGPVLGQRLELEGRRRDGSEFPVELTIWAVATGPEVSFNALLHDASERRRREEELWELALVDELTGLHNRRSFILLAEHAIKEAARAQRPVIGVFVDVDHLKIINDTHGHSEGDRALRLVAGALRGACRESDIVGRLSGDEFAILLAETHQRDGIEDRVRQGVATAAREVSYPLSVSIGVAMCQPKQACHLTELFERADRAMYAEKATKQQAARPTPRPLTDDDGAITS